MSRFFIERPIFATVLAIILVIAGLVSASILPIAQYPESSPPTVTITASYPGASAETLAKTVAAPIEEQLSGVEDLLYFNSTAASNGTITDTAPARRGPPQRRDSGQALDEHLAGGCAQFAEEHVRHALSLELRNPERGCRAPAPAGCGRRHRLRRARLFDAHLAEARPHGAARPHHHRHRHCS